MTKKRRYNRARCPDDAISFQALSADHAHSVLHLADRRTGIRVERNLVHKYILRPRTLHIHIERNLQRQQRRSYMGQQTVQQVRATLLGSHLRGRHWNRPA